MYYVYINNGFEKLDEFFSRFKKLTFKKGETILRAGDEPRGVYFLKKGYEINSKMLATLAEEQPGVFARIVAQI